MSLGASEGHGFFWVSPDQLSQTKGISLGAWVDGQPLLAVSSQDTLGPREASTVPWGSDF